MLFINKKKQQKGGRRILVIIDEVHKFLGKNEMMDDAIEQAYREDLENICFYLDSNSRF